MKNTSGKIHIPCDKKWFVVLGLSSVVPEKVWKAFKEDVVYGLVRYLETSLSSLYAKAFWLHNNETASNSITVYHAAQVRILFGHLQTIKTSLKSTILFVSKPEIYLLYVEKKVILQLLLFRNQLFLLSAFFCVP